ncbi:MAG: 30S ribosomal protein S2 [Crocinitomicaceae bacterium]|jgi:small subunit ribosomal protein S2|nr:30S ribosomal protein S2 [Crocinitomicaceae bacterium]
MSKVTFDNLLEAGVHFGHLRRKWNPAMAPYIFEEKKGIHIIDLNKTIAHLDQAAAAMKQIAKSGKKILFVATKKQAKDLVADKVKELNMPFVTERWSGGMLTNFQTTRKSIRKMSTIDKMQTDGTWETLNKRERLFKTRQREKLEKNFGSIVDMTRQPAAVFLVDILKEHIALSEAKRLNIPIFAMVDTNSDPRLVDFPIPANDDATKSISIIIDTICDAIKDGLAERKAGGDKEKATEDSGISSEAPAKTTRPRKTKAAEPVVEGKAKEEKVVVAKAPEAKVEEVKEEAPLKEAKAKATKSDAKADDLTKIEGIGPKIAETLAAAGLATYADVAGSTAEKIVEMIEGVRGNHTPDTWPKQAGMAAEGKWDELKAWQDEVDGGKAAPAKKATTK